MVMYLPYRYMLVTTLSSAYGYVNHGPMDGMAGGRPAASWISGSSPRLPCGYWPVVARIGSCPKRWLGTIAGRRGKIS